MSQVEIFENESAREYDQFVKKWIPNYYFLLDQIPDLLMGLTDERNLLVAGCGSGNEMKVLAEAGQGWEMTGVDPSPEMTSQARKKLERYKNIIIIDGEVPGLKADISFGAATLLLVLHFLPDDGAKLKLLTDIAQRLKPGAPLILLDITGEGEPFKRNLEVLKSMLPTDTDEEEIIRRLERLEHSIYHVSERRLSELIQQAGFEQPLRFYQTSIHMGWLAQKDRSANK